MFGVFVELVGEDVVVFCCFVELLYGEVVICYFFVVSFGLELVFVGEDEISG